MKFDWDGAKAAANRRRHGVSFEEASSVFYDPFAITIPDESHSDDEQRWKTTGTSAKLRVLLVVTTERGEGVVRIISARPATRSEVDDYEDEIRRRTRGS